MNKTHLGDVTKKNTNIYLQIYRFLQKKIFNVSGKDRRKEQPFASWFLETSFTLDHKCRRWMKLSREIQK